MDKKQLISQAIEASKMAYAPYSKFQVGAALLGKSGKIYQGCNIESASYTPTNCAERTAFFKAISEGEKSFEAICVVGGLNGNIETLVAPCGVCRQVMMEFCDPETFKIIIAVDENKYVEYTLDEMMPMGFGPENLKK